MKLMNHTSKDRTVRALAGFFIVVLVLLQKLFYLDLSVIILAVALNLFQYGLTGWCPFGAYFQKIGWLRSNQ